jgi:hypothetical protein
MKETIKEVRRKLEDRNYIICILKVKGKGSPVTGPGGPMG